jgi:hypothetical protein
MIHSSPKNLWRYINMHKKKSPAPTRIYVASIVGVVFAVLPVMSMPSVEAALMLTVIPIILCVLFAIGKWWICGLLYCIEFLLVRYNLLLGRGTLLAVLTCLAIEILFISATIEAYRYKERQKS